MPNRRLIRPAWLLVGIMVLLLAGCGLFGKGVSFKSDLKLKVAVLPFENNAPLGGDPLETTITKMISDQLGQNSQIILVPWSAIEQYVAANNVPMPLTQASSVMVGRALGVNAVIMGSISEISQISKRSGWRRWVRFLTKRKTYVDAVMVAKVLDVENGIVIGADVGSGESMMDVAEDDIWMGPRKQAFEQGAVSASLDQAVEELSANLLRALSQTPWKGFVKQADGQTATLAAGHQVGIRPGMRFVVRSVSESITNVAGQTYLVPGPPKAHLEVMDASDNECRLKVLSGQVYPGDTARLED